MVDMTDAAAVAESNDGPIYTMTVALSALEALGINLYSNAAAVLSELVANAYDADATSVSIDWKSADERIVIADDGCGMTVAQLNDRFLTAGYKKRTTEGHASPKYDRPYMGRKGIGKLSVFSIANRVVVYSKVEHGDSNGFEILTSDLQAAMAAQRAYHPTPVATVPVEYDNVGTTIVLSDLKTKRAAVTAAALRKRLARRFAVPDTRAPEDGGFAIVVNGSPLGFDDRQEFKRLQYMWEFSESTVPDSALPVDIHRFPVSAGVVDANREWVVRGWFGTAHKPTDLSSDDDAGSLKNIMVLARGRPIQEGIIDRLDFTQIFGSYVTGVIEADFLDLDEEGYEDIATSDRQRLIEDDERVLALQAFLKNAFLRAAEQWIEDRPKREAKSMLARYPKLAEWIEGIPAWQQPAATKMIGTVANLSLDGKKSGTARTELMRSGVLAFQRIALRETTEGIDALSDASAEDLLGLLGAQDAYESGLWVDILRSRLEAVEAIVRMTDQDEKEKVLQVHIFDAMWLLDPSWDRSTGDTTMEENIRKIDKSILAVDKEGDEITGRFDIRYRSAAGRHVIVELKRYSVKTDIADLVEQGGKYYRALRSVLEQQQRNDEAQRIDVVFVLGTAPTAKGAAKQSGEEYIAAQLENINGRYLTYDRLIHNAQVQYSSYLEASRQARDLDDLLLSMDQIEDAENAEAKQTVKDA